jgi:uroporphyrinogen-III synthase
VDTKHTQIKTDVEWVHEIGGHIARGDTLDEALAATVNFAIALVNCDRCFIYVRDGAELALWVWKHLDQEEPKYTQLALRQGYTALLEEHRVPLAISTNRREPSEARIFDQWATDPGETFVSVPLLARKELLGVINLQHGRPRRYSLREVKLLSSVAVLLGADIAISRLESQNSEPADGIANTEACRARQAHCATGTGTQRARGLIGFTAPEPAEDESHHSEC